MYGHDNFFESLYENIELNFELLYEHICSKSICKNEDVVLHKHFYLIYDIVIFVMFYQETWLMTEYGEIN